MKPIVHVLFESAAVDAASIQVAKLEGHEQLSQLFEFELHLVSTQPGSVNEEALLTEPACIVFTRQENNGEPEEFRRIYGMVRSLRSRMMTEARQSEHVITVTARLWQASLTSKSDIYQDQNIQQTIEQKLTEDGDFIAGDDAEVWLNENYDPREFVVQYEETDLNFLQRWTESLGIYYYFDHTGGRDKVIYIDANANCPEITTRDIEFAGRGEPVGVYSLESRRNIVTSVFRSRDYNYRNPAMDILGEASSPAIGFGEHNEFGSHVKSPSEASTLATVRAQAATASHHVFVGASDVGELSAGHKFQLLGHPYGELNLLVTSIRHSYSAPTAQGGEDQSEVYKNEFEAIKADVTYRPPLTARKPKVSGVLTGLVQSESATDFGAIDDEGRYRVAFMYDTVQRGEGKASRAIRMAQPSAGNDRGLHFPLKAGTEVLVYCLNGDPDRPIIAGAVPNPQTGSPVTSANAEKTMLKTNKNELAIDDNEPRAKLSVDGEQHVFQLGQPNAPGVGVVLGTVNNSLSTAQGVATTASDMKTNWDNYKSAATGKSITNVAGIPTPWNWWQKIEAIAKAALGFVKAAGSMADGIVQASEILPANEEKEETAKEQKEAETAQKTLQDQTVSSLATQFANDNPVTPPMAPVTNPYVYPEGANQVTNSDGTTRIETEAEWKTRVLGAYMASPPAPPPPDPTNPAAAPRPTPAQLQEASENTATATASASEASATAAAAQKSWDESPVNINKGTDADVIKAIESVMALGSTTGPIYSILSKIMFTANEKFNETTVHAFQQGAKMVTRLSKQRKTAELGTFGKHFNIQGATDSGALWGGKNAIVAGRKHATVFSLGDTGLIAKKSAHVKALDCVEISSKQDIQFTAKKIIDGYSAKDIKLIAHPSARSKAMPGSASFYIMSKAGILFESETKDFEMKTKDNMKLTAEDKDMLLDAKNKKFAAHGKTGAYVGAGGGSGFGMVATASEVELGKLSGASNLLGAKAEGNNCIKIESSKITATIKSCRLTLQPSKILIDAGSTGLKLNKGGGAELKAGSGKVKIKGSKIMLL
jgi:type VI secretion system VgrG family protein